MGFLGEDTCAVQPCFDQDIESLLLHVITVSSQCLPFKGCCRYSKMGVATRFCRFSRGRAKAEFRIISSGVSETPEFPNNYFIAINYHEHVPISFGYTTSYSMIILLATYIYIYILCIS